MRVYFVIDLKGGKVVAARRGEREKYPPVAAVSEIVDTSDPLEVVEIISPRYLYAADLDRITGTGDNVAVLEEIAGRVEELAADCGFRDNAELEGLPFKPVVGSETFDLTRLARKCYVSLDFREDFLDASGKLGDWKRAVELLNTLEVEAVIVLPLGSVGTMSANFELAEKVAELSDHPVMLGGGIGGVEDLEKAKELGLAGVLVATAVHRRRIPLEIVRRGRI
ncbi:MAG: HisA/HisF family protein [Archaeoglobaceae archaeon]